MMPPPTAACLSTWCVSLCLALTACDLGDDRSAWIHSALTAEHRQLLLRSPERVADKYAAMAAHPYDFFRGTLPLWVADTTRPGGAGLSPTRFASADLTRMLLIGDPHPENVGTALPLDTTLDPRRRGALTRDAVRIEWNDFDAATFGPPVHDLRRLATGLRLLPTPTLAADSDTLDRAVSRLAEGYRRALSGQEAPPRGRILEDLAERAFEARLQSTDASSFDHIAPSDDERRFVMAALSTWPRTCLGPCPAVAVKSLVRRLGAGVASLPLLRFYATLEGATPSSEDDLVLDLKEAREAPALPLPQATLPFPAHHNAERVVFAQRLLQSDPRLDPLLGVAQLDDRTSLRVAERAPSMKGLSRERVRERLADGRWSAPDLEGLALDLGHLLGEAHRRAPLGPDRDDTAAAALAALAHIDLAAELVPWSRDMARRIEQDHALFVALLSAHGPLLESPE